MDRAVILAAGRGTRMQARAGGPHLPPEQEAAADRGAKALMPIAGRPFLDHSVAVLIRVGIRRLCLVVSPEGEDLRAWARSRSSPACEIATVVQASPRGTADALLAAEKLAAGEPFLLLNGDTFYPGEALSPLVALPGPGLLVLDRRPFLAAGHSNIPAERLARFAVVEVDAAGYLRSLLEKPGPILYASLPEPVYLSINAWRMPPSIFEACRTISPSPRGELELPDAVLRAVWQFGERFRVLPTAAPVLDLTGRDDVPEVEARLGRGKVSLKVGARNR